MKIYVDLDHVDITEYTQIESGEYNTNKINFIFTPEYKDLVKVAIFGCKLDTEEPKFYKVYLTDDSCYIPPEVLEISDIITIGCYGYKASGETLNLRYSPTPVKVIVYEGSFREGAENSSPLTPTEVEQIMSRIATLDDEVDDLDGRVTVLEGKACDVDSIRKRVTDLEVEKVDTSTYNRGQAAQDEKIAKAELILSQLPKVTGEGTNFSLSPTIEYDLEVKSLLGDTKQDTLTGKNLCPTDVSAYELGQYNTSGDKQNSNARVRTKNLIPVPSDTTLYVTTFNSTYAFILRGYLSDETFSTSYGIITNESTLNIDATIKYISVTIYNVNDSSGSAGQAILDKIQSGDIKPFICLNSVSDKSFEKYCGGIPSPNPNYPQDILAVTGTQTITISNSDNTETQTYTLHLGDEELAKIGLAQDKIFEAVKGNPIYDSLTQEQKAQLTYGKWYKKKQIGKTTFNGSENENWSRSNTNTSGKYRFASQTLSTLIARPSTNNDILPTYSNIVTNTSAVLTYRIGNGLGVDTTGAIFVYHNLLCKYTLEEFKTFLGNTNLTLLYPLATASTTEITNTTLLQDLNYIKEHISSFPDTTNISTSGNLPIIITASALKQLS